GVFLGGELALNRERVWPNIARHLQDVADGKLKVAVDRTYPLSEAAGAHEYIESRQAFGRVLLLP
ncbi:MAG: zinc-binding dehydrogenase, partial [Dehalococcoidia bacterium]|nr:zinc-binding dehydrogenase [Dehalococcoidia bacterium]